MNLLQIPLNTWLPATWEEFVTLADDPASTKLKGYYYIGNMRFEPLSTGSDHSNDHALILFAISFFAAHNRILMTAKDGCSYRKVGFDEFQPDASYYIGDNADAIPWGIRVINLEQYPCGFNMKGWEFLSIGLCMCRQCGFWHLRSQPMAQFATFGSLRCCQD